MAKTDARAKGNRYYGKVARNYEIKRTRQDWWHVEQREMQDLLESLPKALSVIDIPFGTGRFVPYYLERDMTVSGLDISDEMIAAARELLGDSFARCDVRTGDASALPYPDNSFDLIVSTRFLHDVVTFGQTKAILSEFSRICRTYAVLQFGMSDGVSRLPIADDATMRGSHNQNDLDQFLVQYGFEIVNKYLVLDAPEDGSSIYHFLCQKTRNE